MTALLPSLLLILALTAPARAQTPPSAMLELIDDRLGAVAQGSAEDALLIRWLGEIRRSGSLADWISGRWKAPNPQDDALLAELKPLLPALDARRALFVYHTDGADLEQDALYHLLKFDARNLGITLDKDAGRGVMFVKGDLPYPVKRRTAVHEAIHLEHRPVMEQARAVERAYQDVGGAAALDGGAWSSWLEEGYTETLTQRRLNQPTAKSDPYYGRVLFMDALLKVGGEPAVQAVCEGGDAGPLARFLGPRRLLLISRILEELSGVEGFGGLENNADLRRALRVLADDKQTEAAADEYVRASLAWELKRALMGTGRSVEQAQAELSAELERLAASYLADPQAGIERLRQAVAPSAR